MADATPPKPATISDADANTKASTDIDVLIVGAGPTGLTLALELSLSSHGTPKRPLTYRLIDTACTRSTHSRALVMHARSQELLARHGVMAQLQGKGRTNLGSRVFVAGRKVAEVDLRDQTLGDGAMDGPGDVDTAFPDMLFVSQAETEAALDGALAERYGVAVEWGVEATSVVQDGGGVTVGLRRRKEGRENGSGVEDAGVEVDAEDEVVRCKYVVGCDGAHSIVRRAAGLSFDGSAYGEEFLLADVHIVTDPDAEAEDRSEVDRLTVSMVTGILVILPMNSPSSEPPSISDSNSQLVRLIVSRPSHAASSLSAAEKDKQPTLEDVQQIFATMAPPTINKRTLERPLWITNFHLHHRIVSSYRKGRIFVAGDAAHIHSPAGGQGMNTGIQDAVNLGWKLAAALHGPDTGPGPYRDAEVLLDSYNAERRPVGQKLLASTDRLFRVAATTNPIFLFLRNFLISLLAPLRMRYPNSERNKRAFRFLSQLGIRYRRSTIVKSAQGWTGRVKGGDRAPDGALRMQIPNDGEERKTSAYEVCAGPKHHLLLFAGTGPQAAQYDELQNVRDAFVGEEMGWLGGVSEILAAGGDDDAYIDVEGKLHGRYGFEGPGYVLVRPDGHVAHIGPLSSIDELEAFITKTRE